MLSPVSREILARPAASLFRTGWGERKVSAKKGGDPPRTPGVEADEWMRSLFTRLTVREATATAEVVFHSEESVGDWAESAAPSPTPSGHNPRPSVPPHWEAGIRYAHTVSLALLAVAVEETDEPARFESFTQHCVADVAGTTYQRKLHPYDLVPAREMPEILAHFQRLVYSAAAKDLARLKLESWKRQSHRLRAIRRSSQKPVRRPTETDLGSMRPVRSRETGEPVAAELAIKREARLQAFLRNTDVSVAAVCRAANVHKADMQRWRHGKLTQHSLMSQRIEKVLSGITPLAPRPKD